MVFFQKRNVNFSASCELVTASVQPQQPFCCVLKTAPANPAKSRQQTPTSARRRLITLYFLFNKAVCNETHAIGWACSCVNVQVRPVTQSTTKRLTSFKMRGRWIPGQSHWWGRRNRNKKKYIRQACNFERKHRWFSIGLTTTFKCSNDFLINEYGYVVNP